MLHKTRRNKAMKSALKTIREHCLDCNGTAHEVEICPCESVCKLWPYRFGKSINRAKRELSEADREKLRQRLAESRKSIRS